MHTSPPLFFSRWPLLCHEPFSPLAKGWRTGLAALCAFALAACGPKNEGSGNASGTEVEGMAAAESGHDEDGPELSGVFTVDGTSYTGKVSAQKFGATGQYSVVCQEDAFGLVQITFATEGEARAPQTLKLGKMSYTGPATPGIVHLSLSPFATGANLGSGDAPEQTVTLVKEGEHMVVTFSDVELTNQAGDVKKKISGKVQY